MPRGFRRCQRVQLHLIPYSCTRRLRHLVADQPKHPFVEVLEHVRQTHLLTSRATPSCPSTSTPLLSELLRHKPTITLRALKQKPPNSRSPQDFPLHHPRPTPNLTGMRPQHPGPLWPLSLLALTLPLVAQGSGSFEFKHFHHYPEGQWRTETTVTGLPVPQPAAPMVQTACASPMSPARREALLKMGNDAAPATCKVTVLRDEERTAEAEQVCIGAPIQTIRTTLHAVDDTTLTSEVRSSVPDHPDTVFHITSHFLGACTAAQTAEAAAAQSAPLPSTAPDPEACAQLPSMRQQAQEGLKGCDAADYPEDMRPRCRAQMQGLVQNIEKMEKSCRAPHS